MEKLRLNLDALTVESFAASPGTGGSVNAHEDDSGAACQAGDAADQAGCAASASCPPDYPDQRPA
ncbi:MAG TPA: hypothetical protein VF541_05155 [Longimicrobium sp.]|jgi:hypothetical protein